MDAIQKNKTWPKIVLLLGLVGILLNITAFFVTSYNIGGLEYYVETGEILNVSPRYNRETASMLYEVTYRYSIDGKSEIARYLTDDYNINYEDNIYVYYIPSLNRVCTYDTYLELNYEKILEDECISFIHNYRYVINKFLSLSFVLLVVGIVATQVTKTSSTLKTKYDISDATIHAHDFNSNDYSMSQRDIHEHNYEVGSPIKKK